MARIWDDEALQILRDCYPDHDTADVAELIGTSVNAVRSMAYKQGIKKSDDGLRVANKSSMANGAAKAWFSKGHVPKNKGTKGLYEVTEGWKRTQFKKGHLPANTLHDGAIVVRPDKRGVMQKFIRISCGKWMMMSRFTYEQAFGKIPSGMCVRFIDGNQLNCDPGNLELISTRLNMLLNSKHQYSREIAEVRDTLCELKSTIKQKIDENKHE